MGKANMGIAQKMEINIHMTTEGVVVRFRKDGNGLGTVTHIPFTSVSPGCMDYFVNNSCLICKDDCEHRTESNGFSGCMADSILTILSAGLTDNLTGLPGRIVLIPQIEQLLVREKIFLDKVYELIDELSERKIQIAKSGNVLINLLAAAKNVEHETDHSDLIEKALKLSRITAVLMIDVDHFKKINDSFGHPAGDSVLRGVAEILSSSVKASDWTARYGGEEFVIVLHNITFSELQRVCTRLLENIRQNAVTFLYKHILRENNIPFNEEDSKEELLALLKSIYENYHIVPSQITISIGASISGDWDLTDKSDANSVLQPSDFALYAAKIKRNGAAFFKKRTK